MQNIGKSAVVLCPHAVRLRTGRQIEPGFVTVEEAVKFIDHQVEKVRMFVAAVPADVWADEDVRQLEQFVIGWDRFRVKDIQTRKDVAPFEPFHQRCRIDNWPARNRVSFNKVRD